PVFTSHELKAFRRWTRGQLHRAVENKNREGTWRLTAPIAAHLIARAAYQDGTPLWKGTQFDDLRPHYHRSEQIQKEETHI
ncbi:MAG: hypothetical protein AAF485_22070, partial [Chloroflexota bacterium]